MKGIKSLIVSSFLFLCAFTLNAQDTIEYNGGIVRLIKGDGSLYLYDSTENAHEQGYKAVYYLFTSSKKVYFSNTSDWDGHVSLSPDDHASKWKGSVKGNNGVWSDAESVPDHTNFQFTKREFVQRDWNLYIENNHKAQIRFEADKKSSPDPQKSVLLVVMPQKDSMPLIVKVKIGNKEYDADSLVDLLHLEKGEKVDGQIIVSRGIGVVIDSIRLDGKKLEMTFSGGIKSHDTPLYNKMQVSADFSTFNDKDSSVLSLFIRRFNDDGSILNDVKTYNVFNNEKKEGFSFLSILKIVVECLLAVGFCLVVYYFYKYKIKGRRSPGTTEGDDSPKDPEPKDPAPDDGQQADSKNPDDESESAGGVKNQSRRIKELEKKCKDLSDNLAKAENRKNELNTLLQEKDKKIADAEEKASNAAMKATREAQQKIDKANQALENEKTKTALIQDETDKKIKKANEDAARRVNAMEIKVKEAEERAQNAENKAREEAQKDVDRVRKECDDKIKNVEYRADAKVKLAQNNAQQAAESARKDIESAKRDAAKLVREAEEKAEKKVREKEEECINRVRNWQVDQDKISAMLIDAMKNLADKTKTLGNSMNASSVIGKNFAIVVSGSEMYLQTMTGNINGKWKTLTTSECLAQMRKETESLLQNSSNWINLLYRFSCYSDVPSLSSILQMEGLCRSSIKEALSLLQHILGIIGVSVFVPTLGVDNGGDQFVRSCYVMDTSINRITTMFANGDMMFLRTLIPDNGNTVYEIGQVAYTTIDNAGIHKGKIIYY